MLWFYYFLARSEEERMQSHYRDDYSELKRNTSMFIPGEPGRRLGQSFFGWISDRRLRLPIIYCVSLVAVIGGAFGLRQLSVRFTTHLSLPGQRMAAVSLFSSKVSQLNDLVHSATSDRDVQVRLRQQDGWILVLAAERKGSVVHTMIDAGMTRGHANNLPIVEKAIQFVFLRRRDQYSQSNPFAACAHWQIAFIAETDGRNVKRVIDLDQKLFRGNPVMPVF
jgi:hypothetical protein